MGMVFGALSACCSTMSCCCACAPSNSSTKVATFLYLMIMFTSVIAAVLLKYYGEDFLDELGPFDDGCKQEKDVCAGNEACKKDEVNVCVGNEAVYRMSFSLFVFFTLMGVMAKISNAMHVGIWGVKMIIYLVIIVVSFVIPNDFYDGYVEAARVLSAVFIFMQLVMIIDLAYDLHDFIMGKANDCELDGNESGMKGWKSLYLLLGLGGYAAALTGIGLLYDQYGDCGLNVFFITTTLILAIVVSFMSLTEAIGKGLLTPACVTLFAVFQCWEALLSHPDVECNPTADSLTDDNKGWSIGISAVVTAVSLCWMSWRTADAAPDVFRSGNKEEVSDPRLNAILTGEEEEAAAAKNKPYGAVDSGSDEEKQGGAKEGEEDEDRPGPWMFHLTMAFGGLYLAMMLTNWGATDGQTEDQASTTGWVSLWVKVITQWLVLVLYGWTLVAPVVMPDRDFSTLNAFTSN